MYDCDNLDRQELKNIPNSTTLDVYSDYDLAGRPVYARFGSTGGAGIDYGYDTAKRLNSETSYGRALSFVIDKAGNRTKLTFPDSTQNYVDYVPDALNRIKQIRERGASTGVGLLATISWDPLSRRDATTRGNGTLTDYGYDAASRLNALTQDLANSAQDLNRTFTRNGAGQIPTRNSLGITYKWAAPLASKSYVPDGFVERKVKLTHLRIPKLTHPHPLVTVELFSVEGAPGVEMRGRHGDQDFASAGSFDPGNRPSDGRVAQHGAAAFEG